MRASRAIRTAAVVLAVGLLVPAAAAARQAASDFQWRGSVLQGSAIEIKGVNGAIHAAPASGTEVEVTAVKRARRSNPESVRVEVVQHGDGVTICAVYPDAGSQPNECRPGNEGRMNTRNNDVSVDFTVRVPAGVRFVGRTVNGDVEAGDLGAPVEIHTVNGSITFSTSAYGSASTVNGSIRGTIGNASWSDRVQLKTVNGSITLAMPTDTNTDVHASTVNGDITTDLPMTVTGRVSRRQLNGTIGAGGRSLALETVNGGVTLRRR
jgi:hypothetical protein